MAYEIPGYRLGIYAADVDLSATTEPNGPGVGLGTVVTYQFVPIWLGAAVNIVGHGVGGAALQLIGAFTGPPLGILQNGPRQGEAGLVVVAGITKAQCSGNMSIGDPVGWASNGLSVIKAVTGKFAIGTALETAVAGDITTILLLPRGVQ